MNIIDKHYKEFIGIDTNEFNSGKRIFQCNYRDLPLNNRYFYPIIKTNYLGQTILSVSPDYFEEINDLYNKFSSIDYIISEFLGRHKKFRDRKMYRFAYIDKAKKGNISQKMNIDDVYRLDFGEDFDFEEYKDRKKTIFADGRQFIVEETNKIASIGFISEIRAGGGNIVVMTMENNRNKGYGKEVVKGCINWCIENNVLPIYLVEDKNHISKRIPESLGFIKICEEIIISE